MMPPPQSEKLLAEIERIAHESTATALAVSVYDYANGAHFGWFAERMFHAASTIKLAILLAIFRAADEGRLRLEAPLHVRNFFRSVADVSGFRLDPDGDGDPQLYRAIGRTARIADLAEAMIVVSSNLATNLLLDFVGVEYAVGVLRAAGVEGVQLRRGVGDEAAFAQNMNNETTADGLMNLLRVFRGDFLQPPSRDSIIQILLRQKFTSMIPAGLPAHASVAHKTGEISTACHDAGIVYLPEREPYILVVLSEVAADASHRRETVASVSEAVFKALTDRATAS